MAPFLKSKFFKLIHKVSKNENQPPLKNRTRIDSILRELFHVPAIPSVNALYKCIWNEKEGPLVGTRVVENTPLRCSKVIKSP